MIQPPRFLRNFVVIALCIIIPTLYFIHHNSQPVYQEEDLTHRSEAHWDAGGLSPEYGSSEEEDMFHRNAQALKAKAKSVKDYQKVAVPAAPVPAVTVQHDDTVYGGVIMSKLGNETAKAELGRGTWRLLHLMTLRFPEEPSPDERTALKSYFHLLSRLYPCGECAAELQALLAQYPPQTSSRKSASLWLCSIHNMVNERLGKPEFDCLTLDSTYDCGCGDDEEGKSGSGAAKKDVTSNSSKAVSKSKGSEKSKSIKVGKVTSNHNDEDEDLGERDSQWNHLDGAGSKSGKKVVNDKGRVKTKAKVVEVNRNKEETGEEDDEQCSISNPDC